MGNGKGQDGKRGAWMVRGSERPNDWVLEVNAFCCRIIFVFACWNGQGKKYGGPPFLVAFGMARGKHDRFFLEVS